MRTSNAKFQTECDLGCVGETMDRVPSVVLSITDPVPGRELWNPGSSVAALSGPQPLPPPSRASGTTYSEGVHAVGRAVVISPCGLHRNVVEVVRAS